MLKNNFTKNKITLEKKSWYITLGIHTLILIIPLVSNKESLSIKKTPSYQIPVEMVLRDPPPKPQHKPKKKSSKKQKTSSKPKPKKAKKITPISYPDDQPNPTVQTQTTPVYPKAALNEGLTGKVIADFTINSNGKPIRHKLIKSSGHTILDNSFIQTVLRYYTFKPKQIQGKKKIAIIRLDSGDAFEL